jgi:hypothetical protein
MDQASMTDLSLQPAGMIEKGVNHPEIINELSRIFLDYEAALLANDIDRLNAYFWNSECTVRYGVAEQSYGHAAIEHYRRLATPVNPQRRLRHTVITSFGADAASICTEFFIPGSAGLGRQTQTWVHFSSGWKIVAAHVSEIATPTTPL